MIRRIRMKKELKTERRGGRRRKGRRRKGRRRRRVNIKDIKKGRNRTE